MAGLTVGGFEQSHTSRVVRPQTVLSTRGDHRPPRVGVGLLQVIGAACLQKRGRRVGLEHRRPNRQRHVVRRRGLMRCEHRLPGQGADRNECVQKRLALRCARPAAKRGSGQCGRGAPGQAAFGPGFCVTGSPSAASEDTRSLVRSRWAASRVPTAPERRDRPRSDARQTDARCHSCWLTADLRSEYPQQPHPGMRGTSTAISGANAICRRGLWRRCLLVSGGHRPTHRHSGVRCGIVVSAVFATIVARGASKASSD